MAAAALNPYLGDLVMILLLVSVGGSIGFGIVKSIGPGQDGKRRPIPTELVCISGAFSCVVVYELATSVWLQSDLFSNCLTCDRGTFLARAMQMVRASPFVAAATASALVSIASVAVWLGVLNLIRKRA